MIDTPHEERHILVRTQRAGEPSVGVSVSDVGYGIPSDQLFNVFDSFYTTKEHGMGLGLSISRSIIEAHGGRIWAENNPRGGSTSGSRSQPWPGSLSRNRQKRKEITWKRT